MKEDTMPSFDSMTQKNYSRREWITYYKNVWERNATARLIDVQTDTAKKAVDPEELVDDQSGQNIPVKVRLEMRKMAVAEALEIVKATDALLALSDDELVAKTSDEALKVAEDMMPKEPKVGDVCMLADGKTEGVLGEMDGKLVCVEKEPTEPATPAEPAAPAEATGTQSTEGDKPVEVTPVA